MFCNKEYILEVYKEKSFSKAAKNLYISQPSLSASVKRIEDKIGAPVFDRSTNPVSLTEIGSQYIKHAIEIEKTEHNFLNYINDCLNILKGEIKIGGSSLFSSYILPPMISRFNKLYPHTNLKIHEDNTKSLVELLISGELDVIMDNTVIINENISSYFYTSEILLLAVPKKLKINDDLTPYSLSFENVKNNLHMSEDFPTVSLDLFKDESFIFLKHENDTGKKAKQLCKKHGFSPKVIFELDQQVTAYNIACTGMGICFVSDTLIKNLNAPHDVVYYKLSDNEIKRNIYFYVKSNRYISNACRKFININLSKAEKRAAAI